MTIHPTENQKVETGIPHSGNAPEGIRELPVDEFNMPLADAVSEGLVTMPTTEQFASLSEEQDEVEAKDTTETAAGKESRFTRKQKIIAITSILASFATGGAIAAAVSSAPKPVPTATADANKPSIPDILPSETPQPNVTSSPEVVVTPESLAIPEGLDADTLGKTFEERLTQWHNAGANQATLTRWISYNGTIEEFTKMVSEEQAQIFEKALLPDNWEVDYPSLIPIIDSFKKINIDNLTGYLDTAGAIDGTLIKEAYSSKVSAQGTTENPSNGTVRSLDIKVLYSDNRDKTNIPATQGPRDWTDSVQLKPSTGQMKLIDFVESANK